MERQVSRRHILAMMAAGRALAVPQAQFSSNVSVVSLLVTVRDKNGKFVNDLKQEDFAVSEEGRPQTISYFSRQYDLPLTIGLLVDTSGSQVDVLGDEIAASKTFFRQVLREGMDQAFLSSFDAHAWLLRNLTGSPAKLEEALEILDAGLKTRRFVNGTVLYDDITDSAELILAKQTGRKALVLLTDGEDTASRGSLERAVEACQRADTVVYSIGIGTGLARGGQALDSISQKTGGRFFTVSKKQTVETIYQTIEEELRSQYNIGYLPPAPGGGGKSRDGYHTVRVAVTKPGVTVRTRDGYYSGGHP